jgi:hypothetical protein
VTSSLQAGVHMHGPSQWSLNVWGCFEKDVQMGSADVHVSEQHEFKVMPAEFYLEFNCVT